MFSTILVALDGSDHSKKALDTAVKLAKRCDAELILFHAIQLGNLSPGYAAMVSPSVRAVYESVAQEQADAILGEAEKTAVGKGIGRVTRLAKEDDSAAAAILSAAASANAELVVIGTRGLTGLRGIAMGSVAHKVTAAAHCPVMIIR